MGEFTDDEQRDAYVAGLRREADFKRVAGKPVVDVEAELARVTGETPAARSRKATSAKAASARRRNS